MDKKNNNNKNTSTETQHNKEKTWIFVTSKVESNNNMSKLWKQNKYDLESWTTSRMMKQQ